MFFFIVFQLFSDELATFNTDNKELFPFSISLKYIKIINHTYNLKGRRKIISNTWQNPTYNHYGTKQSS